MLAQLRLCALASTVAGCQRSRACPDVAYGSAPILRALIVSNEDLSKAFLPSTSDDIHFPSPMLLAIYVI